LAFLAFAREVPAAGADGQFFVTSHADLHAVKFRLKDLIYHGKLAM
jgi:hypothetical protein